MDPETYEATQIPKGIRKDYMFTTKADSKKISVDDNGAYLHSNSTSKQYSVSINSDAEVTARIVHMDASGQFFFKQREKRIYNTVLVEKSSVYTLHRYYRKSKSFPGLRQLIVKIEPVEKNEKNPYCCVIYSNDSDESDSTSQVLPHGNSRNTSRPYIRTTFETLTKIDDHLKSGKTISQTYSETLNDSGGPLKSSSQSEQPRDRKQVQNRMSQLKQMEGQSKTNSDRIYNLLCQLHLSDIVHSITVKKDFFCFTTMTSNSLNDISQFCCGDNAAVLGIDTTFNLRDMWVTDTCYRNKRLVNPVNKQHPIFIGPTLFHFTKDESTFSRLALELIDAEPKLVDLKFIGVDLEEAITEGMKRIIPNVNILYCVRHLKQRDEEKLKNLLAGL